MKGRSVKDGLIGHRDPKYVPGREIYDTVTTATEYSSQLPERLIPRASVGKATIKSGDGGLYPTLKKTMALHFKHSQRERAPLEEGFIRIQL